MPRHDIGEAVTAALGRLGGEPADKLTAEQFAHRLALCRLERRATARELVDAMRKEGKVPGHIVAGLLDAAVGLINTIGK